MPGTLYYFDAGARADCIRSLLFHSKFDFTDVRLTPEEFEEKKATGILPLGGLPCWDEEGIVTPQSGAILRMLGIRLGYYSCDPMTMWKIDSIIDFVEDNANGYYSYLTPIFTDSRFDENGGVQWI